MVRSRTLAVAEAMTRLLLVLLLVLSSLGASPAYRRADWPHWSGRCPDVRQQVLIEESRRLVIMTADGCRVLSGEWLDIYGGELVTSPAALDVDHVVPLAAAHRAGGWRWTRATRQAYANDLVDPDHLVAVSAALNRQKGDKGPSRWLPPRMASRCGYVRTYQAIAERWRLTLPAADRRAIRETLATCPVPRA